MTSFGNKTGMMEFENAVYADIESYRNGGEWGSNLTDEEGVNSWIWTLDNKKPLDYIQTMKEYKDWIIRLSTGSVDLFNPTEIATAQKWSTLFGQYDLKYNVDHGYKYEGVDYQFNALLHFIKKSTDCK